MRLVVALGGNAMTAADGTARPEDQLAAVESTVPALAGLVSDGHELLLTHGNGPQVGNLLVKNELAASVVPPVPLDWCGAQTQGTIGALLLDALDPVLARRTPDRRVAVLVSRTLVDAGDPGFSRPTKPIGRYLPRDEAQALMEHGQVWQDRGERGWRRVVASPEPLRVLETPAALALLAAGFVVVAAGGGGIPTVELDAPDATADPHGTGDPDGTGGRDGTRRLAGVEAVIDKDLTAGVLARDLEADVLVIATDVPNAVLEYGTARARPLEEVPVGLMRRHAADGHFAGGSMGPKVEAVCRFVESTGRRAAITSLDRIADAVAGTAGTRVVPDLP